MSVTVLSRLVDPDVLIPRTEYANGREAYCCSEHRFTPWVFEHAEIAERDCTESWPNEWGDFKKVFGLLNSYYTELNGNSQRDLTHDLKRSERTRLPKKNWKVSRREYFEHFMRSQGMMLRELVETIYQNLKDAMPQAPRLHYASFPVSRFEQKYVIGGQRYISRPDGAAMVSPKERRLPIISFAGWYEGQTWSEFLAEILSIMLGQLAKNIRVDFQDQEVFIVGFYGRCIYIARGYFTTDLISQVQLHGYTEDETIEIQFTRGCNLSSREDWLEAMDALTGLLRYQLSGNAMVSALKPYLHNDASPKVYG
ncbi:hypothetical protein P170DRAFT_446569 [Aspergillus steynii IBT 23096]|uniref:Uncharacterized protein n=1 Tax=Aspergillus steynii IBT 23096 TaxID=1392250 RepID=A0A2I2G786_9EURO|nr:uncharacterized protein P170DRAFT_446569 [Aspergillus steynii IBT 23096]PLB48728.1 hypothetical protein P170DRAFT_446569 [Aspergillus steynii IBT 23096]